ncbi:MAG TPA: acyl-CoA thioester hydrolase/BAAT C-terminal domain-containing protein [Candidatus Baltobacteraceae bacterium]|nr:acyl-CoA thioester hydrolase/BAAT C-terminal domain-containing protein [Candidatus Baltobacteraceae bacterium]
MLSILALALAAAAAPAPPNGSCTPAKAFVGTICVPQTDGRHPAILLLGGSEGGDMMKYTAPQFTRYGYVAASVAYFNAPGLPQTLENIPVETVGKALADIAKRPDVDPNRIAIMGVSKGGEFALLAASTYPQIRAVIADVPSPFAWQGIAQGPGPATSSWTQGGKPVPYVLYGDAMGQQFAQAYMTGSPLDLRKGYDPSMTQNKAEIPAAMFHLENIRGPVLCFGADDDQIWNSDAQCQLAMQYLRVHHHAYADQYLHYAGAGHLFLFSSAQRPLTQAPMGQLTLMLGGTSASNLAARSKAWPKIGAFLQSALGKQE